MTAVSVRRFCHPGSSCSDLPPDGVWREDAIRPLALCMLTQGSEGAIGIQGIHLDLFLRFASLTMFSDDGPLRSIKAQ